MRAAGGACARAMPEMREGRTDGHSLSQGEERKEGEVGEEGQEEVRQGRQKGAARSQPQSIGGRWCCSGTAVTGGRAVGRRREPIVVIVRLRYASALNGGGAKC